MDDADNQISYNSDYIAEFHFDDEWNGKIKTARFVQNGEHFDVVLVDDRCDIPPLKTGFVRIGVFTDSMTSTYADVYFKTSIKDGSGNPAEPPEDVYAQLTALIESGMLKGEDGLTPYVGENDNWWIGEVDTGVLARGTDGYTPVKGVDYFTEGEVQQIQNEISESIQANINHLEINKADKSELDKTNLSLDALWKMNRGQTYDVLEQESEAYSVDVPSGSRYVGMDMVGGKSVVWNQLVEHGNFDAVSGWSGGTVSGNVLTITGTSDGTMNLTLHREMNIPSGHKTLTMCDVYCGSANNARIRFPFNSLSTVSVSANTWTSVEQIGISDTSMRVGVQMNGINGETYKYRNFVCFDLTAMFGSTIADYIYSLEQATTGAGVAWFKNMFPDDYYPYSEPTIISSQNDRVDVRGKNLINHSACGDGFVTSATGEIKIRTDYNSKFTQPIEVVQGESYYFSGMNRLNSGNSGAMYDANMKYVQGINNDINAQPLVVPNGVKYVRLSLWGNYYDNGDSTLAQFEKGTTATPYKPYSYKQIPTNLPILRSAGAIYDYIDLNEGKLHRRVGEFILTADADISLISYTEDTGIYLYQFMLVVNNTPNDMPNICNRFTYYAYNNRGVAWKTDGAIVSSQNGTTRIATKMNMDELKTFLSANEVIIQYVLTEPVITDITIPTELSDWLTVEAGGSITFHNTDEGKRLLIPNKLSFIRKLDEVTV